MSTRARQIATVLLVVVGVQLWLIIGRGQYGSSPSILKYLPIALAAAIPWVNQRVMRALEWVREPTVRQRGATAMIIAILATVYLIFAAFQQKRDLIPKWHDEQYHLLQMRMMAQGRLWMPQHPAADSFETFHILVKPVYAPIYFPGASLIFLPGMWLGWPAWLAPAIVAGIGVGLLYRVVSEMIEGVAGLLAALMLISLEQFRYVALAVLSHGVIVCLGLALVWAWLRWRRMPTLAATTLIGAIAGLAAITRPIDALCYALPVGVAMSWRLRRAPWKRSLWTAGALVIAATPFLTLQAILNLGVTGSALVTPDQHYLARYMPGVSLGFQRSDPAAQPQTSLPQIIKHYHTNVAPAVRAHQPGKVLETWKRERLERIARFALPSALLLILVAPGPLALRTRPAVLAASLPLLMGAYALFPYLLPHYVVVMAPGIILLVLLGLRAVIVAFPRAHLAIETFGVLWIGMLSIAALPGVNRLAKDDIYDWPTSRFNASLPSLIREPAIVLYRFHPENIPDDEPVYNAQTAWPDEARIIRAHDLGAKNRALFEYYSKIQPNRRVYRVDRLDGTGKPYEAGSLEYLGTVNELAR